jgi:AraC-like DNA-binding protein
MISVKHSIVSRVSETDSTRPHHSTDESCRFKLHDDDELGLVEDAYVSPHCPAPSGEEKCHQIVVPYYGLFSYTVGQSEWLLDSNSILLISPGWDFRDDHPLPDVGHAALLISPSPLVLDELCGGTGVNAMFKMPKRTSNRVVRLLTGMLRRDRCLSEPLRREELVVRMIRSAFCETAVTSTTESRVVRLAKEALHAVGSEPLSLTEIARAVNVSPVYLSQEFSRVEGMPLYQYQLRLRLNRALSELEMCESITNLALDLGFSSHSHFSSAFRSIFGLTPSQYRAGNHRSFIPVVNGHGGGSCRPQ